MGDRPLRVLRLTPRLDWTAVEGAGDELGGDAIGGMAVQVRRLGEELSERGVEQVVVAGRPAGVPRRGRTRAGTVVVGVGPAGPPGVHRAAMLWLFGVVRALPRLRRARPDVVHAHASGLAEPLAAALLVRWALRRPLVLTLHCSAQVTYRVRSRRDAVVQVATRALERAAVRAAARTLVLTERARRDLGAARVEVLPDVVEAGRPAPATARERAVVGFVGRIAAEKGWRDLLAVAEAIEDAEVVVVGDGPDRAALEAAARLRGVADRVRLAGAVAPAAVPSALAGMDVLVLPSEHEELGSVLLEAAAAGVPGVAYAVGGVSEAIRDGETGLLVPPGDVGGLVAAVRRVLDDRDLREAARVRGPQLAARHTAPAAAERLLGLYEDLRP